MKSSGLEAQGAITDGVSYMQPLFVLKCDSAAQRPILSFYQGDSLTNPMLIVVFYRYQPEYHWEPSNEIGSLSLAKHLFVLLTFQVIYQDQVQHENWTGSDLWNFLITINPKDKNFHNSIDWFFFKFISLHNWDYLLKSLQITRKCILESPPYLVWSDH